MYGVLWRVYGVGVGTVLWRVWVRCAGVGCTYGYRVYVSCGVRVMNEGYNVLYSYER